MFEEHFGRLTDRILDWKLINAMVSEMFSHDPGAKDFTETTKKVGFYGNDGVCLFKYFIRTVDPQKQFVWGILNINFLCFVVISICYILISTISAKSSGKTSRKDDEQTRQRNTRMNQKMSIIITTDFICWMPFIVICVLHYLELLDATPWYSVFSMVILPINSVINPVLYNDLIMRNIGSFVRRQGTRLSTFTSRLRSRRECYTEEVVVFEEGLEMQEV